MSGLPPTEHDVALRPRDSLERRSLRLGLLTALCILPIAIVGTAAHAIADGVGTRAGRTLATLDAALRGIERADDPADSSVGELASGGEADAPAAPVEEEEGTEARSSSRDAVRAATRSGSTAGGGTVGGRAVDEPASTPLPVPTHGLRVSAGRVLAIADSGGRPEGVPIEATSDRPAGLVLSGVGTLGIGLRDGDILTHAAGAPVRTEADVVSAVIAARNRRARAISGRLWRNGEPWQIVVGLPYLDDAPLDARLATRER